MKLPVTLTAPAKLTVSLRITDTRDDGYHLIDAEMVSLDFADVINLSEGSGVEVIAASGLNVPVGADNLVSRALAVAGAEARAVIDKAIPAGAGLGGGSSDAAAVLAWAGIKDNLVAAGIGADVAFCLRGGRARVTGIGEVVEPLAYVEKTFTLLTPPIGVSTPLVYRAWDELGGPSGDNGNDLEPAALSAFPELARWRDALEALSDRSARLAGSGGTWFVEGEVVGNVDGVSTRIARTVPARRPN